MTSFLQTVSQLLRFSIAGEAAAGEHGRGQAAGESEGAAAEGGEDRAGTAGEEPGVLQEERQGDDRQCEAATRVVWQHCFQRSWQGTQLLVVLKSMSALVEG